LFEKFRTSTIFVAEIRKSPNVSQTYRISDHRQNKLSFFAPRLSSEKNLYISPWQQRIMTQRLREQSWKRPEICYIISLNMLHVRELEVAKRVRIPRQIQLLFSGTTFPK